MRREVLKQPNKSKEKEQHNAIIDAVAREQLVISELETKKGVVEKQIEILIATLDSVKKEVVFHEGQLDVVKEELTTTQETLIPLQSEVDEIKREVALLSLSKEEEERSLRHFLEENAQKRVEATRIAEDSIAELTRIKTALESEIATKEEHIAVLSKSENIIADEINSKKREIQNVDASIERRQKELAQINLNLASSASEEAKAKRQIDEVAMKLQKLKEELVEYDKQIVEKNIEISEKEKEVEAKREEFVALIMREKKVGEKGAAIKELFRRAGIDINI